MVKYVAMSGIEVRRASRFLIACADGRQKSTFQVRCQPQISCFKVYITFSYINVQEQIAADSHVEAIALMQLIAAVAGT